MTTCDKCGKPVDPSNDASILEAIFAGEPAIAVWKVGRHLLPVEGCQGSPSRAQYLEGRPRDTRGYPYISGDESKWRRAYAMMITLAARCSS